MTIKLFLKEVKRQFSKLNPGNKVGSYTFLGINKKDGYGSPGGRWGPKEYPAFELQKGEKKFLLRIISDRDKIVIEAVHLSNMLINYTLKPENFVETNGKFSLLENYAMTVQHRRSFEEVKQAMIASGMTSNIIFKQPADKINLGNIVDSLFTWADFREKAKSKIRGKNENAKVINHNSDELVLNKIKLDMTLDLNQIFFGPPGTGKTYKLQNELADYFIHKGKIKSKEEYTVEVISELSWWQVLALVLLEGESTVPEIKKHPFVKHKLLASNTNSLDQTIWGQLSSHTIKDSKTVAYTKRFEPLFFNKKGNSVWYIENSEKELISDLLELHDKIKNFKNDSTVSEHNYKFTTFHQSLGYEDFIEGIKPVYKDSNSEADIEYHIEKGIFYRCCDEAAKLAGFINLKDAIENYTYSERKNKFKNVPPFGLFIDEINRGNVSSIFGELITLIEKDKRLGENEILVELPYSKKPFGVPPNLYIIGTMNTADRSVEALDAALRRRFSFVETSPDINLVNNYLVKLYKDTFLEMYDVGWEEDPWLKFENGFTSLVVDSNKYKEISAAEIQKIIYHGNANIQVELEELFEKKNIQFLPVTILQKLNQRIEKLLDKDHQIGHSYFMSVKSLQDLIVVFKNKIIPLLQEYFFGDYGKIGLVLGKGFFEAGPTSQENLFADFDDYDASEYSERPIYKIKDMSKMTEDEFKTAITTLLKK